MPDVYLYTGEANPNDVKLRDPTTTGAPPVTGTLAVTLADDTMAASATETFTGTLATTLAGVTLAATATETFTGTLAVTLGADTLSATATETFTGTLATTLSGDTLASTATETFVSTLATTLDGVTLVASGSETITGTLAVTLGADTLVAGASNGSGISFADGYSRKLFKSIKHDKSTKKLILKGMTYDQDFYTQIKRLSVSQRKKLVRKLKI